MSAFVFLSIAGMIYGTHRFREWDESSKTRMSLPAKEALLDAENERLDRLLAADFRELHELRWRR